jgi:hypothetical protein
MIKIICKKCNKEMCVSENYIDNTDGLCADCLEKRNGIYSCGPMADGIPGAKISPYTAQCSKCNKIMVTGNPPLVYRQESYCGTHREDAMRKDEILIKCQACGSNATSSFIRIHQGKKLCPLCCVILQHGHVVNASKAYREKIASMKKVTLTPIGKLPEIKKQRLTNKNWMDVAYKTPSKSKK